jgi:hypothetical protein
MWEMLLANFVRVLLIVSSVVNIVPYYWPEAIVYALWQFTQKVSIFGDL